MQLQATAQPDVAQTKYLKSTTINIARAAAALLVLVYHVSCYFWQGHPTNGSLGETISRLTVDYGWLGVTVFFVLSGLCIHLPQARKKTLKINAKQYAIRRFVRLYPPYIVVLLAIIAMRLVIHDFPFSTQTVIGHFVLWFHEFYPLKSEPTTIGPVFWSLAVEAHLYVLYVLIYPLLIKLGIKKVTLYTFIFSVAYYAAYQLCISANVDTPPFFYPRTFALARFGEWMLGAYLAEVWVSQKLSYRTLPLVSNGKQLLLLASALIVIPIAINETWHTELNRYFLNIPCAIATLYLIAYLLIRENQASTADSNGLIRLVKLALDKIGDRSYSLYLVHYTVISIVGKIYFVYILKTSDLSAYKGTLTIFLISVLGIAGSFVATELLYQLVEKPSHHFARKLTSSSK